MRLGLVMQDPAYCSGWTPSDWLARQMWPEGCSRQQQIQDLQYALNACDQLPDPAACRDAHARPWIYNPALPVGYNSLHFSDRDVQVASNDDDYTFLIAAVVATAVGAALAFGGGR